MPLTLSSIPPTTYMFALSLNLYQRGAGVRHLDELDFAYGFGLTEKIVKGNGIKRCKKGQEAVKTAKCASGRGFLRLRSFA